MIYGGNKIVAVAGTPEPLTSERTMCAWVVITATPTNMGTIFVVGADPTTKNAATSASGLELEGGNMWSSPRIGDVNYIDLNKLYIDADTGGESVKFLYGVH